MSETHEGKEESQPVQGEEDSKSSVSDEVFQLRSENEKLMQKLATIMFKFSSYTGEIPELRTSLMELEQDVIGLSSYVDTETGYLKGSIDDIKTTVIDFYQKILDNHLGSTELAGVKTADVLKEIYSEALIDKRKFNVDRLESVCDILEKRLSNTNELDDDLYNICTDLTSVLRASTAVAMHVMQMYNQLSERWFDINSTFFKEIEHLLIHRAKSTIVTVGRLEGLFAELLSRKGLTSLKSKIKRRGDEKLAKYVHSIREVKDAYQKNISDVCMILDDQNNGIHKTTMKHLTTANRVLRGIPKKIDSILLHSVNQHNSEEQVYEMLAKNKKELDELKARMSSVVSYHKRNEQRMEKELDRLRAENRVLNTEKPNTPPPIELGIVFKDVLRENSLYNDFETQASEDKAEFEIKLAEVNTELAEIDSEKKLVRTMVADVLEAPSIHIDFSSKTAQKMEQSISLTRVSESLSSNRASEFHTPRACSPLTELANAHTQTEEPSESNLGSLFKLVEKKIRMLSVVEPLKNEFEDWKMLIGNTLNYETK
ncbi:hypothetical protein PCE1_003377 [Barthelona sp. PCE]